jgi:hypothetical protein
MDTLFYIFAGATGVAAALASIAIWAPRKTSIRVAALLVAALFIPIAYVELVEMLSKPKPMSFEWLERSAAKATVLGVSLHEGTAIYMWLRLDGAMEPRYYVLPWRQSLAERLEDAIEDAVARRTGVIITKPFDPKNLKDGGELNVEIVPPPTPPLKKPLLPPQIFNPREFKI